MREGAEKRYSYAHPTTNLQHIMVAHWSDSKLGSAIMSLFLHFRIYSFMFHMSCYVLTLLSNSINLFSPAFAFACPSAKPTDLDSFEASSYFCLASLILPSISKNSPKLWVATAQPMSHSSFRSGDWMEAACASALVAHWRA
jgi:hypothetical protein